MQIAGTDAVSAAHPVFIFDPDEFTMLSAGEESGNCSIT